ncbi:MAG TPA: hypothetical protein VIA18_29885 [Polyangia bacterium]|nr:hypothetical protein [Polyangia bacterium]
MSEVAGKPFWSGARDEEQVITKFVERSLRLQDYLFVAARRRPLLMLDWQTNRQ